MRQCMWDDLIDTWDNGYLEFKCRNCEKRFRLFRDFSNHLKKKSKTKPKKTIISKEEKSNLDNTLKNLEWIVKF